jgi:hypothetical protein
MIIVSPVIKIALSAPAKETKGHFLYSSMNKILSSSQLNTSHPLFAQIMLGYQTVLIIRHMGCALIERSLCSRITGSFLYKFPNGLILKILAEDKHNIWNSSHSRKILVRSPFANRTLPWYSKCQIVKRADGTSKKMSLSASRE